MMKFFSRRRYLAIKHLDEDVNTVKKFQRQSKYEVGSAEWNPCDLNSHLCAISVRNYMSLLYKSTLNKSYNVSFIIE